MRRVPGADVIPIVNRVLATVIREVMPTVITSPATYIRTNNHAVTSLQRDTFEVRISPVAANRRNRPHVFMSLDDWEGHLPRRASAPILARVPLVGVFVGPADSGDF